MQDKHLAVSIAGKGWVAQHLAEAFRRREIDIDKVWTRTVEGLAFAESIGAQWVAHPSALNDSRVVLLCLSDDALQPQLIEQFPQEVLLAHTAGSVPLSVFGSRQRAGVFYPLQSFSPGRRLSFDNIPLCLEARRDDDLQELIALASRLTGDVRLVNSEQRKHLHLAAVFVSNFVNHLYKIARDMVNSQNMDFSILYPLIQEVSAKVMEMTPEAAQTGPALRGDNRVMQEHMRMLENHPDYRAIYQLISQSIQNNTSSV